MVFGIEAKAGYAGDIRRGDGPAVNYLMRSGIFESESGQFMTDCEGFIDEYIFGGSSINDGVGGD